jgi:hypothetical protein
MWKSFPLLVVIFELFKWIKRRKKSGELSEKSLKDTLVCVYFLNKFSFVLFWVQWVKLNVNDEVRGNGSNELLNKKTLWMSKSKYVVKFHGFVIKISIFAPNNLLHWEKY